jgi:hypothetical protein
LPAFQDLDPIIYFWTDGARRFFIFNRQQDPSDQTKLAVIPFNATEVGVESPAIITLPAIADFKRFFWVRPIGAQGAILAGTESGVASLQ